MPMSRKESIYFIQVKTVDGQGSLWALILKLTFAPLLPAYVSMLVPRCCTGDIVPHSFSTLTSNPLLDHLHAVFFLSCVIRFPTCPRCEPKDVAVSPLPDSFFALVVASKPKFVDVFPFHTVQDVFSDGRGGDRGQMAV